MVDISQFRKHPVYVDGVDHDPGEHGDAEVVQAHRDERAQEGQFRQLSVDQDDDEDENLKTKRY